MHNKLRAAHWHFLSHPLGYLEVTTVKYAFHVYLIVKRMIDFLYKIIEYFSYLLQLRNYDPKYFQFGASSTKWVIWKLNVSLNGYV